MPKVHDHVECSRGRAQGHTKRSQDKKEALHTDIAMMVQEKKIITEIYYKPTDTHNNVPFNSTHPKHTLKVFHTT